MTHSQSPSFFLLVLIDSLVTILVSSLTSNETDCALSIHSPRIAHPTFDRFGIVEMPLGSELVSPQSCAVADYQPRSSRFSLAVSRGGACAIGAIGQKSPVVVGVVVQPATVS